MPETIWLRRSVFAAWRITTSTSKEEHAMKLNWLKKSKRFRQDAGIALLTTLLLLFMMSSLLVGFSILLASSQRLAGTNNDQVHAFYASEAGMEQLTAGLGNLFN